MAFTRQRLEQLSYQAMRVLEAWSYFPFAGLAGLLVMNVLSAREMFARTRTRFLNRRPDDRESSPALP
jgi:hypothetical protein